MTTRAWTLGYPPAYEKAIRIPGNAKAPAGYVFPTREAAIQHRDTHLDASRYEPYEIILPRSYAECTTRNLFIAHRARHRWHRTPGKRPREGTAYMDQCALCNPIVGTGWPGDHDLLTVAAPFVNPEDT